jgi:hypothetical protein
MSRISKNIFSRLGSFLMKQVKQQISSPLRYSVCHVPSFLGASDVSANATNPSDVQDEISFNLTSSHQIDQLKAYLNTPILRK